jgi:hypothetical protein
MKNRSLRGENKEAYNVVFRYAKPFSARESSLLGGPILGAVLSLQKFSL